MPAFPLPFVMAALAQASCSAPATVPAPIVLKHESSMMVPCSVVGARRWVIGTGPRGPMSTIIDAWSGAAEPPRAGGVVCAITTDIDNRYPTTTAAAVLVAICLDPLEIFRTTIERRSAKYTSRLYKQQRPGLRC